MPGVPSPVPGRGMSTLGTSDVDHFQQALDSLLPARLRCPWIYSAPVPEAPPADETCDPGTASGPPCLACNGPVARAATGRPRLYCDRCGHAARQRSYRARKVSTRAAVNKKF